ncbi:putative xanthine dehydrogenase large subunit [Halobacteriovorax marinus SJ]|uniref:Xanthine dehydrogenase large subunit n=1 Tax=Halobacteriovorax marinus (strain ATCC BAA-682 / DSM 15412 / SJ) TaxID=862908 RepID=E1WY75_HALMS|nr:xanthine dehydrogenase molybdopterin binding subunit [Halobacteriovorax marinus]CBW27630.1 putative xanthine dehydrogenase large subunit [Halobacteriovorax marinus SJ]
MTVGKNIPHDSAVTHVSGESIFIDDRAFLKNEVVCGLMGAPIAHGRLKNIDISKALEVPGVLGIYTHKDLASNRWGAIVKEQPILVDDIISYESEPVCVIAAENYKAIEKAKQLIQIEVEEIEPILSLQEAIDREDFLSDEKKIARGNVEESFSNAEHTLEGFFENGGQEHFYLESHACAAIPLENNQIEVHSSSQHPSETQHVVAQSLGLSYHQVVCVVKRMGGGFGGKESQAAPFASLVGLCAKKLKRPARLIISKDDDMKITGKRHPFKNFWKVAFDKEGKILGYRIRLFSNGGAYTDLSESILERAMLHSDGCYYIPNVEILGRVCKTNIHSNTAFRGFGGPQGNATIESVIEEIAHFLKKDSLEIREKNIYQGDKLTTPYGQIVDNNTLPELMEKIKESSNYLKRREEIEEFNKNSATHVKGLALTGTKFGIAFTARFLNQANALVNLHLDGTVQVSTGATEMGQGVNTKIQQIAANAFGIDASLVQVMPTSTEKNHNTSPTAASSGSDLNGMATLIACNKIKQRLASVFNTLQKGEISPADEIEINSVEELDHIVFENSKVRDTKTSKEIDFKELISTAYFNRVSMGDYAFYKTPGLGFDKAKGKGQAFNYYTNGLAVSEVLIDRFTGETKVLRADVLMDLGRSINPGIDMGQVSGAFIQGMGWVTSENLTYSDKGVLLSHSPTTYKIPSIQDTPREFNIDLIENNTNDVCVHRSKAVGEPPFLLGNSVWNAVKDALYFANPSNASKLKLPATCEEIVTLLDE